MDESDCQQVGCRELTPNVLAKTVNGSVRHERKDVDVPWGSQERNGIAVVGDQIVVGSGSVKRQLDTGRHPSTRRE